MPRQARKFSEGDYFHVMVRGINKQKIFYDDDDRKKFLSKMQQFSEETEVLILAWCLMGNHINLWVFPALLYPQSVKDGIKSGVLFVNEF